MKMQFIFLVSILVFAAGFAPGQTVPREWKIRVGGTIEIKNHFGRVDAIAKEQGETRAVASVPLAATIPDGAENSDTKQREEKSELAVVTMSVTSSGSFADSEIKIKASGEKITIEVEPAYPKKRIDIVLHMPERMRLKVETQAGEVRVSGDLELIEIKTDTGTIAADVPTDDVKYQLFWTSSKPRFLSDFELEKVKEKSAGRFQIKGRFKSEPPASAGGQLSDRKSGIDEVRNESENPKSKIQNPKSKTVNLDLTTARGIILLNVPPNEVSNDLRERPLTLAAKAIIRSGDSILMEAIRRASPKYFGDYSRTLPPMRFEPAFSEREKIETPTGSVKSVLVRVHDHYNRAIGELKAEDFEIAESSRPVEIVSVQPATAPVNLVLLLDVSGSVGNYVNFIRKAARSFVDTVAESDRISIITFNDDVQVLSGFSTNKEALSKSLDTFDAGGGTAYYDALAFTLAETLRPLKGERTAIVILTDGDDNRSFLPFDPMIGAIEESGAIVYPLYVPSLIAASESDSNATIDSLRSRYLNVNLTSKAKREGETLAKVSGGIYFPITRVSQINQAYEDIVKQLRTAYTITYRSPADGNQTSRLKVNVKKENAFVYLQKPAR